MANTKDKYGAQEEPVQATRVYRRKMPYFGKDQVDAWAWILVDDNANPAQVVYVNTYNGKPGKKWTKDKNTRALDEKKLNKKINDESKPYEQVEVSDCPIVGSAPAPAPAEATPSA